MLATVLYGPPYSRNKIPRKTAPFLNTLVAQSNEKYNSNLQSQVRDAYYLPLQKTLTGSLN